MGRKRTPNSPNLIAAAPLGGHAAVRRLVGNRMLGQVQASAGSIAGRDVPMPPLTFMVQARNRPDPYVPGVLPGWNETMCRTMDTLDSIRRQKYNLAHLTEVTLLIEEDHYEHISDRDHYRLEQPGKPDDDLLPLIVRKVKVPKKLNAVQTLGLGVEHALDPWYGERPELIMCVEAGLRYVTDQAARATAWGINEGATCVFGARLAGEKAFFLPSLRSAAQTLGALSMNDATTQAALANAGYTTEFLDGLDLVNSYPGPTAPPLSEVLQLEARAMEYTLAASVQSTTVGL